MKVKWLPLLGAALFLTGCADGALGSGTVSSKEYIAPWNESIMTPVHGTSCDYKGRCTTITMWIPVDHHHAECWAVNFWDGNRHGSACVSHEAYDTIKIGDHYGH